ncbi:DnaJ domain-containing protein [Myxococcota bacterium]|nr:DnaJ domain-containing protein [Myxococcota bacterium]
MRDDRRVPQISEDCDPGNLARTPAEGYLLSRIDGVTPWSILCEIGGLNPDEVDAHLERWMHDGSLVFQEDVISGRAPNPEQGRGPVASGAHTAKPEVDPDLEISIERQREILEMENRLDASYWELLGVSADADAKAVKRAYFALSKKYHPDRYFGREIGEFEARLTRIFRKLVEASELLLDPTTPRISDPLHVARESSTSPPTSDPEVEGGRAVRRRAHLENLRRHLRPAEKVRLQRRFQGVQLFETAKLAIARKNWCEAATCLRLAIVFDPQNPRYLEAFPEVLTRSNLLAVEKLMAVEPLDIDAIRQALDLCEEALAHRPRDIEANHRAAGLALELGERELALEYAETARVLAPQRSDIGVTHGRVLRASGFTGRAKEALQHALSLDSENLCAQKELAKLTGANQGSRRKGESWIT